MNSPFILRIEASAGAGKTYRLTSRFLELLASLPPSPANLRSIVAITFTNKAAAEMKERLIKALKSIALETSYGKSLASQTKLSPEVAHKWLKIIFENFNDLQVRTIDSLIFSILRGVALEAGLRPDLEAELKEDILLARAYDRLLLSLREGESDIRNVFREVLLTFLEIETRSGFNPEKSIRKTLLDLFRYELKGKSLAGVKEDYLLEELAQSVEQAAKDFLAVVQEEGLVFRYSSWEEKFLDPLGHFNATPFHKDYARELFKSRFIPEKVEKRYTEFKERLEEYLLARAIVRLIPYARLYEKLKNELERLRRQEGLIHGGGWIELVEKFLREEGVPLVYCKLGSRFRHFLIDEFQDTSQQQWSALKPLVEEALSQGGTLTYVGDIKQAIYVWRGGDPRLFNLVPQELPAELIDEPLPFNWRAKEALVSFNNSFFELLAEEKHARNIAFKMLHPEEDRKRRNLASSHAEELAKFICNTFSRANQKLPEKKPGGQVKIIFYEGDTRQAQEEALKEKLKDILQEKRSLIGQKSLAILVRTNNQAEDMACLLFEMGIPAVTENALRLTSSPVIKALISLLSFLDYPYDNVALAGFLRSPVAKGFLNLPEEFWLEAGKKGCLKDSCAEFDKEGFKNYLEPLLAKAGFLSPYDLVREIMFLFKVYERFPAEEAFLHRFLSLVLAFEQEGAGLSSFLEHWEEKAPEERLGLPEEVAAVRVLTIHAAKGLEFDVVFLPFIHWEIKTSKLVSLEEGTLAYVQKPYPQPVKEKILRERAAQALENLNLLYVAFTRAKEELFVFVPEKKAPREQFGTGDIVRTFLNELGFRNAS
ncbi:UvrD/REP helicase [Thermodesulfatator indicus DSM 15286]|uniref:DNA 3'-5' helicase n=1 Tax=Thermodesulfatator indicus (strain DSM 15286 / JCM 11887 / CIR29812) TaxID=667014 RepID=F8ABH6_THEID|nr:UvrD-helicase domain-containing protein [Thermodesulfatator indicus]AEH44494.1 UvrD/REP helicase [Thermodesulfatator indicus DSM 15286]